jgi:hypothetical protein
VKYNVPADPIAAAYLPVTAGIENTCTLPGKIGVSVAATATTVESPNATNAIAFAASDVTIS